MENELISTQQLEQLIDEKRVKDIRQLFEVVPTIDIAEACDDFEDVKKLVFIFKYVKAEYTADLFTELSVDIKEELIRVMSDAELAEVLEGQFTDDLVDDLEDLPANLVYRVLKNVPKERRQTINKLLNYKESSAGSIMTTEFLTLLDSLDADDALKQIKRYGKTKETVFTLFVIDKSRKLVGTLDLDDLIFAKDNEKVEDIMNRDFVTCHVNDDQEEVANLIKRYDLNAIAVLNNEDRLAGLVTVDDIIDVIQEEADEDVAALSHVTPLEDSYLETSPFQMFKKCVPWILILMVLGTFSTIVLSRFDEQLALLPALAAFIPVIMDVGGNSGGQTIALMIRGLANKEFGPKDILRILGRELLSALMIASVCAAFAFVWFSAVQYLGIVSLGDLTKNIDLGKLGPDPNLYNFSGMNIFTGALHSAEFAQVALGIAGIVAIALFIVALLSKIIAVLLPLTVAALKRDPAIIAQPLLTTIIDVTGILVYFGAALLMFAQWL